MPRKPIITNTKRVEPVRKVKTSRTNKSTPNDKTNKSAKDKVAKATPVSSQEHRVRKGERSELSKGKTVEPVAPKKSLVPVTPVVPIDSNDPGIDDALVALLNDHQRMNILLESALTGMSIGTMAARVGINNTVFYRWLVKGKNEPNSEYGRLWEQVSEALAIPRGLAEAQLAKTNPQVYLSKGSSRLLGDDWVDTQAVDGNSAVTLDKNAIANEMLEALKILRTQNIDLNQIIDEDRLSLKTETPVIQKEQNVALNQLIPQPAPTSLQNVINSFEQKFQLERIDND